MLFRGSIGAAALTAALLTATAAQAFDDAKYPDLKGQWHRAEGNAGAGRFDPTKPPGQLQGAPLTAEYQAIYEANLANKEAGGQGSDPTYKCLPPGMPRIMHAYAPMEVVVMPDTNEDSPQLIRIVRTDSLWASLNTFLHVKPVQPEPSQSYSGGCWNGSERPAYGTSAYPWTAAAMLPRSRFQPWARCGLARLKSTYGGNYHKLNQRRVLAERFAARKMTRSR
jgi:hypothetical protein